MKSQPLLILITGPPAAGKTVLARNLADRLQLPLIAKDTLKERLYDSLGFENPDLNKKLGGATFDLLYDLVEEQLRAGRSLIVEAAFWRESASEMLLRIIDKTPARPIEIHFTARTEVLVSRFAQREITYDRHPGHKTGESVDRDALRGIIKSGRYNPLCLTHEVTIIDTSDFGPADFNQIEQGQAALLTAILKRSSPSTKPGKDARHTPSPH